MTLLDANRGPNRKFQKLALAGAVYFIWKERNRRLFQGITVQPIQLFKQIRDMVIARMALRNVKARISDV